jgi:hypothetical protein
LCPNLVHFKLVNPAIQPRSMGPYLAWGTWFLSCMPLEGTWSYLDLMAVTGGLRCPGDKTPIVAPEPSVEWVVEAVHSTGGRIGTHMSLWVPPRYSVVMPWGKSLHGCDSESRDGTHRVAPEAAADLKA